LGFGVCVCVRARRGWVGLRGYVGRHARVCVAGRGGGGLIAKATAHLVAPCYVCVAVTAALPASKALTSRRPRRAPAAQAAVAGRRRQRGAPACGPLPSRAPTPSCVPSKGGMRLYSVFLGSPPPCVRCLQMAKRACVLGAGVHVRYACWRRYAVPLR
jgi:hypothetical protein